MQTCIPFYIHIYTELCRMHIRFGDNRIWNFIINKSKPTFSVPVSFNPTESTLESNCLLSFGLLFSHVQTIFDTLLLYAFIVLSILLTNLITKILLQNITFNVYLFFHYHNVNILPLNCIHLLLFHLIIVSCKLLKPTIGVI